ncbi:hypothetical protein ACS5PN_26515 [Roseateles sp. NT4]|uniref:hypothetical protein n=1 Tax=Roseateles sp. NT4 TaxID=3453715 RepID=UPI003EED5900
MRSSLLDALAKVQDVTDVIVMTHNVDFTFLQTLALRALTRHTQPRITVFADAQCAQESFASQRQHLTGLGLRYRVVPVAMAPGFRFHPKVVLLAGPSDATLFVGSGNLGLPGWRENAEVWVRCDASKDDLAPFAQFRSFALDVISRVPLNDGLKEMLTQIYDPARNAWAAGADNALGNLQGPILIGRAGSGPTLQDKLLGWLNAAGADGPVEHLYVCCPYYDEQGVALAALLAKIAPARATLLYQPKGSTLTLAAHEANPHAELLQVTAHRGKRNSKSELDAAATLREVFVHAKFYAVQRGDEVLMLAGSANCSVAALTLDGNLGNAELMAAWRMTTVEFQAQWLQELTTVAGATPVPAFVPPPQAPPRTIASLRILAARLTDDDQLRVAFSPATAQVVSCLLDDEPVQAVTVRPGILSLTAPDRRARHVVLVDVHGEHSPPGWVDDESRLLPVPASNKVVEFLADAVKEGELGLDAWIEGVKLLTQSLNKMPSQAQKRPFSRPSAGRPDRGPAASTLYPAQEVLPEVGPGTCTTFDTRSAQGRASGSLQVMEGEPVSIATLVARWFDISDEAAADNNPQQETSESEEQEGVDAPTRFRKRRPTSPAPAQEPGWVKPGPSPSPPPSPEPPSSVKTERLALIALVDALTNAKLFVSRPADMIADDLRLAAMLLTAARCRGFIGDEWLVDASKRAWVAIFVDGGPDAPKGWLANRLDDPALVQSLQSPTMSAALLGWACFAVQSGTSTLDGAMFELLAAQAIAQHAWIFQGGSNQDVALDLGRFALGVATPGMSRETVLADVYAMEMRLAALGAVANTLIWAVENEIVDQGSQGDAQIGDLLLQRVRLNGEMALRFGVVTNTEIASGMEVVLVHWVATGPLRLTKTSTRSVAGLITRSPLMPDETASLNAYMAALSQIT